MKNSYLHILLLTILSFGCASNKDGNQTLSKGEIFYSSGTNHLINKKYTEALKDLLEAVKLEPKNSDIHNNLGMAYYFKGEPNLAKFHLEQSIKLNSDNSDAKNNLASIHQHLKNSSEAKKLYEAVLKDLTYPNQYRTFYNLGLIESQEGNVARAKELFSKSVENNENYCPAYFQLGLIAYNDHNFKDAYDHFKNSSVGDCYINSAEAIYYQGLTSVKLGNLERARLKFIDVVKRFPNSEVATKAGSQIEKLDNIQEAGLMPEKNELNLNHAPTKQSYIIP